jgi:hypothetical protein
LGIVAEKNRLWRCLGSRLATRRSVKAEVHHLVGLVEHEDLDPAQRERAVVDQVEQAAWRGDEDVDARHQPAGLADGHATEHAIDREIQVLGVALHVVGDLRGEFAGGRKHEHPARGGLARLGSAARRWSEGNANAAVLPVPVWAMPSRSRPSSSAGIDWRWMGWDRCSLCFRARAEWARQGRDR